MRSKPTPHCNNRARNLLTGVANVLELPLAAEAEQVKKMKKFGIASRSRSLQGGQQGQAQGDEGSNDEVQKQQQQSPLSRTQSLPAVPAPIQSPQQKDNEDMNDQEGIEVGRAGNIDYVQPQGAQAQAQPSQTPQSAASDGASNKESSKAWQLREQWKKSNSGREPTTPPVTVPRPLIGRGGNVSVGSGTSQPIAPFERSKLPPPLPRTIPAATGTIIIGAGGVANPSDSISTLGTADIAAPPKPRQSRLSGIRGRQKANQQKKKQRGKNASANPKSDPNPNPSLNNYLEQQFLLHRQQQQEHYDQELQNYVQNQLEINASGVDANGNPSSPPAGAGSNLPPPPPMSNYDRAGYHRTTSPGGGDNSTITSIPEDLTSNPESDLAGEDSLVKEPSIISQEPTTLATMIAPEPYNNPKGMEAVSEANNDAFHPNQFQSMEEFKKFMELREQQRELMKQKYAAAAAGEDEQVLPVLRRPKNVNYREPSHANIFCYGKYGTAMFATTVILLIIVLVIVKPDLNNGGSNDATPTTPTSSPQATQPATPSPTSILSDENNLEWYSMGNLQGTEQNGRFGHSVVMDSTGSIVASGSPWSSNGRGHVQIHTASTRSIDNGENSEIIWQITGDGGNNDSGGNEILSPFLLQGENEGDQFGRTIALNDDGTVIAVSSLGYDDYRGLVQVYQNVQYIDNTNDWMPLGEPLQSADDVENGCFGKAVALNSLGNILAVSSSRFAVNETIDFYDDYFPIDGSIEIFELVESTNKWQRLGQAIRGQTDSFEECGAQIDLSDDGQTVVFSCPRYNNNQGRIAMYEYSSVSGTWEDSTTTTGSLNSILSGKGDNDDNTGGGNDNSQQQQEENDYFGGFGLSMSGDGMNACASSATGYYRCFRRYSRNNDKQGRNGWHQLGREISSLLPSGRVLACSLSLASNGPNGLVLVSGIYLFFDWRISTGFSTIHWYHDPTSNDENGSDGSGGGSDVSDWVYIANSERSDDFLFIGQNIGDRYGSSTAVSQNGLVVAVGADSSVTGGNVKLFGARKKG